MVKTRDLIHKGQKSFIGKVIHDKFKFKYATKRSITKIIRSLNDTSALGVDMIPTKAWKLGVEILAGPIATLINLSLCTGKVPKLFKQAKVHPVHKGSGKDPRQPSSYRPISILPSLSKVLEIVVRDALLEWLDDHSYLPESQNGFRPGRSVAKALSCAQADWAAAKSQNEAVAIIAFDLSAAFDTVGLGPLTEKLQNAGVHDKPLSWIQDYMSGRSQSVVWNDNTSKPLDIQYGVPQGSILGPLLFLIMVADLHEYVTQHAPENVSANMTCYADDTTLYASSKSVDSLKTALEQMSDQMIVYCSQAGLVINEDKTQMMCSGVKESEFSVKVGNATVYPSNELKLLGITFDTNFTTIPYLRELACEAKTRASIIKRLSYR